MRPVLDIDGVLWFLAVDNALINNDGYWTRASDYSIYRDAAGRFHVAPHDMNEAFGPAMGFGFGPPGSRPGGRPGGEPRPPKADLDPLVGLDNSRTPLRSRLLAVPSLRALYLDHVRAIANDWLDWAKLGPVVAGNRALIERRWRRTPGNSPRSPRSARPSPNRPKRPRRPAAGRSWGCGRSRTRGASTC